MLNILIALLEYKCHLLWFYKQSST